MQTTRYDPNGNVVQQTTQTSDTTQPGVMQTHTTAATYNAADWLLSTTDAGPSALLLTQYGYDAAGQQRTQTIVDGVTRVTTTLDAQGRATAIGEALGGVGPYTSTFGYTANDLPLTATLPNGVQQSAQYDPNSRLTSLSTSGASGLSPSSYRYGYNAADWTTSASGISGTDTITHDAQGRLTAESGPSVLASLPGQTYRWSYDGNGNILTGMDDFGSVYTNTYSLSSPNQLAQSYDPSSHSNPTNTTYFAYDRHGDTTAITTSGAMTSSEAISTGISYDAQERPLTLTHKDASYSSGAGAVFDTVSAQYNAQGLRSHYTVVVSGTAILDQRFSYRDDSSIGQVAAMTATLNTNGSIKSSGTYTDTYVYGPVGEPLEFVRQQHGQTTRYWYVLDGNGSVVAVTDSSGAVVDHYAYDSWGEMLPGLTMQQVPQQLRYDGYWQDDALGWYWVSIRYYDPEVMRWMQPDPTELDGAQTYVYVGNDPADLSDPAGTAAGPWTPCAYQPSACYGSKRTVRGRGGSPCNDFFTGFFKCYVQNLHKREAEWNRRQLQFGLVPGAVLFSRQLRVRNARGVGRPGSNYWKGAYGEYVADKYWEQMGYQKIGGHPWYKPTQTGIDAVYRKLYHTPENVDLPEYIISEAKFGSSTLASGQMDPAWIVRSLPNAVGREMAGVIVDAGYVSVLTHVDWGGYVEVIGLGFGPGLRAVEERR